MCVCGAGGCMYDTTEVLVLCGSQRRGSDKTGMRGVGLGTLAYL